MPDIPPATAGPRLQGFERDLTEAEVEALKERFREAQRTGKIAILADDNTGQRIADAVAAERERCATLADQHAATVSDTGLAHAFRQLADRIREEDPDGT
jgi:hypothetical protein